MDLRWDGQSSEARARRCPNSEWVLDPDGKIVRARLWSNPRRLRSDLETLVGKVENPTKVSELDLKIQNAAHSQKIAQGVVPRIKLPGPMRPIMIEPRLKEGETFYVKLRAEADTELLRDGKGKLYLGFHVDPIYGVHWNNRAAPLSFELKGPKGVNVSPGSGKAPEVKEDADVDPREFLVEIEDAEYGQSLELTVHYFACTDEWCEPFTQSYQLTLKRDRDGGFRFLGARSSSEREFDKSMVRVLLQRLDRNKDNRLTRKELSRHPLVNEFKALDKNQDNYLDRDELRARLKREREEKKKGAP